MLDPKRPVQVLAKEGWNPGVLRNCRWARWKNLHQPVIVFNIEDGIMGAAPAVLVVNILRLWTVTVISL